jgi:DNA (cytosine-5)-methyltransferase 1
VANTLNQFDTGERDTHGVVEDLYVRRLTPIECERLQGFPDNWTLVNHRNKPAADGPRYKALGNSMAVPVMRWIGKRIFALDNSLSV